MTYYTSDERDLISTSLKNLVAQKRSMIKKLGNQELYNIVNNDSAYKHYKKKVQFDLQKDLMHIIELLNDIILEDLNKNKEILNEPDL